MPDRRLTALTVAVLVAMPSVAAAHTGPLAGYRWVAPPPEVGEENRPPLSRHAGLPATHDRLLATEVWTGDLQAVLSLPEVMLPERERTSVSISIAAVDPVELPAPPAGQFADGNAYRVELDDAGTPIDPIDPAGWLTLTVPHQATTVLFSPDRARWTVLGAEPADREVTVEFARPGFYLAVADHPLGSGASRPGRPRLALVLAVPVLVLVALLVGKRRLDRTA